MTILTINELTNKVNVYYVYLVSNPLLSNFVFTIQFSPQVKKGRKNRKKQIIISRANSFVDKFLSLFSFTLTHWFSSSYPKALSSHEYLVKPWKANIGTWWYWQSEMNSSINSISSFCYVESFSLEVSEWQNTPES